MRNHQEGAGSVRFVSVPDFSKINRFGSVRFGSVRFGNRCFPVRRGSACVFRTRRGSVRFGSVRPVRFGFLFLPESPFSVFPKVIAQKVTKQKARKSDSMRKRVRTIDEEVCQSMFLHRGPENEESAVRTSSRASCLRAALCV